MEMNHPPMSPEEVQEAVEHRDALLNIRALLATSYGKSFIKYLLKSFGAGEVPELGLEGSLLMDKLGFLRAGESIFALVAEANADEAGKLIALIKKEKNERLYNNTDD